MPAMVVLCTVSSRQEARKLTKALVGEKLAACVSTLPGVDSTYWWKGKIETAKELLLLIKTDSEKYKALENRIRRLHSYTVPEILALPVSKGNPDYLRWLGDSVRNKRGK